MTLEQALGLLREIASMLEHEPDWNDVQEWLDRYKTLLRSPAPREPGKPWTEEKA